jgi:ferrochelatase
VLQLATVAEQYDAVLILSFGGPEQTEDVLPFLENVTRGRGIPRDRLLEVAEHYYHFGGKSPINEQNRMLIAALEKELAQHGPALPVYWGNRNWSPLLADTLRKMQGDGVRRALAFVTSVFSSYSGCRQYLEDIQRARSAVGAGAPEVHKLRSFYNHPGFIDPMAERVHGAFEQLPAGRLFFTAHSIPVSMAKSCDYERQLQEACRLVAERAGQPDWRLVYQSRSGAPGQPWLEPDVLDALRELPGGTEVILAPIGFISDHMEVLYDLDTEARELCEKLGLKMIRAGTVGVHPKFISLIREMIHERLGGASHDECAADCCPAPVGRPA